MNDLDQDLREMFRRHEADVLGPVSVPPGINRRVRRRQAGSVAVAIVGVLALFAAGFAFRAAVDRGRHPAGSPTLPPPAEITGVITTVAGNGVAGSAGDGLSATEASLAYPVDLAVDAAGNLFILEFTEPGRVRKVDTSGNITTAVGPPTPGGSATAPGDAGLVPISYATALAIDAEGDLFVATAGDSGRGRVVEVDPRGSWTTIAGTGIAGFSGDGGPATAASLGWIRDMDVDTEGNLYLTDGSRVRKVDTSGVITTIAGTGTPGFSGDGGPARQAQLTAFGIFVDTNGVIFVSGGAQVRRIDRDGIITTVAGTSDRGYSGDGGLAARARLFDPEHVWVDSRGAIFILDSGNHCVRRVDTRGIITTIAGTGSRGSSGDGGPPTKASFSEPSAMTIGPGGVLYIGDSGNNRVRKVVLPDA